MITRELHKQQRSPSSQASFLHCQRIAAAHYENFPVASRLIPSDKRKYVAAIYAFARIADDFADEPGLTPAERVECLQEWEQQLVDCYDGTASDPVFVALRETSDRFHIPVELFQSLLQAFRQDVSVDRYETFEDLLAYCQCSANPVGRLVLLLMNYRSETLLPYSDSICTALQLTNFWQDISVDLKKDRVYLPLEDLERFGYSLTELFERSYTKEFQQLLSFEVERTKELFYKGKPLFNQVGGDLSLELKLTWNGGMRILEKIRLQDYDVLRKRPKLSGFDKALVLIQSLLTR